MRPRIDFYTLCPQCETQLPLTLASKLQSGRAGCSCACDHCKHEWIAIHEWIYRDQLAPLAALAPAPAPTMPYMPPQTTLHGPAMGSVPRPHISLGAPAANPVPVGSVGSPVPAPHAWNWERQQQPGMAFQN